MPAVSWRLTFEVVPRLVPRAALVLCSPVREPAHQPRDVARHLAAALVAQRAACRAVRFARLPRVVVALGDRVAVGEQPGGQRAQLHGDSVVADGFCEVDVDLRQQRGIPARKIAAAVGRRQLRHHLPATALLRRLHSSKAFRRWCARAWDSGTRARSEPCRRPAWRASRRLCRAARRPSCRLPYARERA